MKLRVIVNREVLRIAVEQRGQQCSKEDDLYEIEPDIITVITVEDTGVIHCYNEIFDAPSSEDEVTDYDLEI